MSASDPAAPPPPARFTRIGGWEIEGFGHFVDASERDLPGGLVVFHGPNESGKSTLLAFLRAVLFGFPHGNSREQAYEPTRGGRHAGRVVLETESDSLVVERARGRSGLTVSRRGDGEQLPESVLTEALGHADRELYRNVFAFGLGELQSFDSLGRDGVSEKIFSAGIRGAGRSARDALERLQKGANGLFRPRARTTTIHKLVREIAELDGQLAERRTRAGRYAELARDESEHAARLGELRRAAVEAGERERRAGQLLELWLEVWSPLGDVRDQLAKLEVIEGFPERAVERLEILDAALETQRNEAEEIEDECAENLRARERLSLDPALPEVAADVARLAADRSLRTSQARELEELERLRDEASANASRTIVEELGAGWDEQRVLDFDASLARAGEARRWREQQVAAAADHERAAQLAAELERELARAMQRRDEGAERIAATSSGEAPTSEGLAARRTALAELQQLAVESRVVEQELEACGHRRLEAEGELAARGPLIAAVGLGGAALVLLAVARHFPALLQAAEASAPEGPWPGIPLAVLGSLGWLAASALLLHWGWVGARRAGRKRAETEAEFDASRREAEGLVAAITHCGETLGRRGAEIPLAGLREAATLQEIARELDAEAEALVKLELLRNSQTDIEAEAGRVRSELESAQARAAEARRECERVEAGWEALRGELGLPQELVPEEVPSFTEAIRRSREALRSRDAKAQRCRDLAEQVEEWNARLRELLELAGRPLPEASAPKREGEGLSVAFEGLVEACARDGEARLALEGLDEQRRQLERRKARALAKQDEALAGLQALFVASGARDGNGVRARSRVVEEREMHAASERKLERELERKLGRGASGEAKRAELERGAVDEWRDEQMRASDELEALDHERDEAVRKHHELQQELAELERSTAVADLELEREAKRQELAEAVEEWRRLQIAGALVGRTLERFERERQPGVLREASRLFQRVTDGRYEQIAQSSESEGFDVVETGGARKRPSELSRGTAEQLYLSVRLGLIAEFSQRSRALPIVMDDVIVNFDDRRADEAAELLASFAAESGRQLLYFTCSGHTRDRLRAAAPQAELRELAPAPSF